MNLPDDEPAGRVKVSKKRYRFVSDFTLAKLAPRSRAATEDFGDHDLVKGQGMEGERELEAEAPGRVPGGRASVRCGRPARGLEGKVEERILDAAGHVFLERGFSGASVDEIAEVACAGKPTIYARFPSKQALFTAVVARLLQRNTRFEAISCADGSIEERLQRVGAVLLSRVLTPETIGLIRVAVAEARRFPDLATSVSCMGRDRPAAAVSEVFAKLAASDDIGASPAFAPERLHETARRFLDLMVLPMLLKALFGADLAALRAEIGPHSERAVAFFLDACCGAETRGPGMATPQLSGFAATDGSVAG